MQRANTTSVNALAQDLQGFLRVSESTDTHRETTSSPPQTIGRSNAALRDLQGMRSRLSPLQANVADQVAEFYETSARPCRNGDLGFQPAGNAARIPPGDQRTLARRASFLLNSEAIKSVPGLAREIPPNAGVIGHSTATMAINAVLNSVKSQTELVNAAAVHDARRGARVCPMTLQPEKFDAFLRHNAHTIANIVDACRESGPRRNRALQPHLEALAKDYFAKSRGYPGAPELVADDITVNLGSAAQSKCATSILGKKKVTLNIDSDGADAFCRQIPSVDDCEDFQTLFRAHMMQGFEQHSQAKKLAALTTLSMLHKAGEVQEWMGTQSAGKSSHSQAAQNAALHTLNELQYPGNPGFGDALHGVQGRPSQRDAITEPLEYIPGLDTNFQSEYLSSMITDERVRKWVHSTNYEFDLRSLREPSGRLLYQALASNTQALRRTLAFQSL